MEIANPVVDPVVNSVVDRVVIDRFVVDRFVDNGLVLGHSVVVDSVRSDVNSDLKACVDVSSSVVDPLVWNDVEVDDTIEEVENGHKKGNAVWVNDLDGVVASVVSVVADVVGVPRVSLIISENSPIFYFMVRTTKSANFHPLPFSKFCLRIILNHGSFLI